MNSSDDGVSEVIHKAMSHAMRRRILLILTIEEKPMSPVDLEPHFEGIKEPKKLSNIAYHVRRLEKAGLVKLVKIEPVRGVVKRLYGLTKLFTAELPDALALDAIAELLEGAARDATEGVLDKIGRVLAASGRPIRPFRP
jgi:DNA-binding transcriptional ArsR family regulator